MEKLSLKIKKYEKIILGILQEMKALSPNLLLIVDKPNRHYQVVYAGTDSKGIYSYRVRVHFHLREDGKICLFENATELEFLDILLPKGIPKTDLLPTFIPESMRQMAGYAV
jgi:XisI protein